jgi:hypothetical protein
MRLLLSCDAAHDYWVLLLLLTVCNYCCCMQPGHTAAAATSGAAAALCGMRGQGVSCPHHITNAAMTSAIQSSALIHGVLLLLWPHHLRLQDWKGG